MTALPDIPRLYTALAELLAVVLYSCSCSRRISAQAQAVFSAGWGAAVGAFLQATDSAPLMLWIPCMIVALAAIYLYVFAVCEVTALGAAYQCARAFILAEFAASLEWQIHCFLWPQRGARHPLSLLLLAAVYTALYGLLYWQQSRRQQPDSGVGGTGSAALNAVVMALVAFAVSNLSFLQDGMATMNVFYIRTLVDFSGMLSLTLQHEQLREAALHQELAAMDSVLHRQYEQYRQSKENIRLINGRYHELKMQIAAIRAEHNTAKQAAALARMESGIQMYEAQNKTGNPVLDTLLTAKSMYCQQNGISLTCVADGHLLDFLTTGEICTIVGTALDNATESVTEQSDPEKRLIRVAVYAQNGFVMLRFENYCETPVPLRADGLPAANAHGGYDLKSVRAAAERRSGTMTLHWENSWFTVRILLPRQRAESAESAQK